MRPRQVRVWDTEAESPLVTSLKGHGSRVRAMATSLDGLVCSGDAIGGLHVWDVESQACVVRLSTNKVLSMTVTADGLVATGGEGGKIMVWALAPLCGCGGRS